MVKSNFVCKFKNLYNVSLTYAAFRIANWSRAIFLSFGNASDRSSSIVLRAYMQFPTTKLLLISIVTAPISRRTDSAFGNT